MRQVVRRLLTLPVMLLGMTIITFTITHLIPADPARVAAGLNAPEEQVERLREELGLNKPLYLQYVTYMRNLLTGDFGKSMLTHQPVAQELKTFLPATLELVIVATIMFLVLGILVGVFAGVSSSRVTVTAVKVLSFAGMALPVFWLGLMFQVIFYRQLNWLPAVGRIDPMITPPPAITGFYLIDSLLTGDLRSFLSSLTHILLPASASAIGRFGVTARFIAAGMKEVLQSEYVRTARSKGLSPFQVIFKHALRNVLIPVTTMTGLQFGWLIGGSVLVEAVFSWPGLGWYAWRSIVSLDFLPIMGVTLVLSFSFIVINLVVDILYDLLDPRIATPG